MEQQIHLRLSLELLNKISEKAKEMDINRSALIRIAIAEYLKKEENKENK